MADRTEKVSLLLEIAGYVANAERVAAKTREIGTESDRLVQKGQAIQTLGHSFLTVGTLAAAGLALVVAKAAEFDSAISGVQAATHESVANLEALREAALKAGADTVFSATEAANAEAELAKAGVLTADILGGALKGSLDLASAGSLGVADAASIAATAMTQFGLSGAEVPHIADLLAAGAGKAQGSVQDLSAALNQGGLVAAQAGFSIEDTTATLAAFASAGLIGSDAGTSLKSALLSLEAPSNKAQDLMRKYGINIYDANGKMLSFSGIAGQLKTNLSGLTEEQRNSALATIFGTDAVRAASILYLQGSEGIDSWNDKVNDSGYAAETARIQLDNLGGDVEALGGSIDTGLIKAGSGANEVLRFLTQSTTGLVNSISSLPAPVVATGVGVLALVAGVGLLGGGLISIVPKIAATKVAMQELNITGKSLATSIGKGGLIAAGIAALGNGISNISSTVDLSADKLAQLQAAINSVDGSKLDDQFKIVQGGNLAFQRTEITGFKAVLDSFTSADFFTNTSWLNGASKAIDGVTAGLSGLSTGVKEAEAQFREIDSALVGLAKTDFSQANEKFQQFVEQAGGGEEATRQLLQVTPQYKAELISLADAAGGATDDQSILNLAMGQGATFTQLMRDATAKTSSALADVSAAATDTTGNIKTLSDEIKNFGSAQFDVEQATNSFYSALDSLSQIAAEGAGSLDRTSEAGRKTSEALLETASSTNDLAAATYSMGGSTEEVNAVLEQGRQSIIATRIALGETAEQAQAYADRLIATPQQVQTQVQLSGVDSATGQINSFIDYINSRVATITVNATNPRIGFGLGDGRAYGGTVGLAGGGTVFGPGSDKSDSVLNWLSRGEEVIQNPWSGIFRSQLKEINEGRVPTYWPGAVRGYANGPADGAGSSGVASSEPRNINMNVNGVVDPTLVSSLVFQRLKAGMAG